MTDADKVINLLDLGSDSAYIRVRIPDHFCEATIKFNESGALGIGGGMNSLSAV